MSSKDIALKELTRIEKLGLIEKGDFRTFHIMIEECIKRFILDGVSIPTSLPVPSARQTVGMTTIELLESVEPAKNIFIMNKLLPIAKVQRIRYYDKEYHLKSGGVYGAYGRK